MLNESRIKEMLKQYFRSLVHYQYEINNANSPEKEEEAEKEFKEHDEYIQNEFIASVSRMINKTSGEHGK